MKIGLCDIHNHILYGLDDGAKDLAMSLNMARAAYEDGTRTVIATPHYNPAVWNRGKDDILARFEEVKAAVLAEFPDMRMYSGCEIFWHDSSTTYEYEKDLIPTLAGSRYVLFEFMPLVDYSKIREAVIATVRSGKIPILAHIERFACLVENPDLVYELSNHGAYFQVNASSVVGGYGRHAQKFIKKLMKDEMIDFIGTDAHADKGGRTMTMQDSYKWVEKKMGTDYADRVFITNPEFIIRDKYLD
ncbi:MAG: hypothetical protein K5848_08550 [Lachnospiraceae bacterium]|nr:hypothetical protein [Lachnospiraceae bacterium]